MPLTVECVCPGDPGVDCQLQNITIYFNGGTDCTEASMHVSLDCGEEIPVAAGPSSAVIPLDCATTEGVITFTIGRSLSSDEACSGGIHMRVIATYVCIDGDEVTYWDQTVVLPAGGGEVICTGVTGTDIIALCSGQGGSGVVIRSRPLGCTEVTASSATGWVIPEEKRLKPPSSGGCFCASGGSGSYGYSLVDGQLSGDQWISPLTGCVMGEADPDHPGTGSITVRAFDLETGDFADVTCGLITPGCEGAGPITPGNRFY